MVKNALFGYLINEQNEKNEENLKFNYIHIFIKISRPNKVSATPITNKYKIFVNRKKYINKKLVNRKKYIYIKSMPIKRFMIWVVQLALVKQLNSSYFNISISGLVEQPIELRFFSSFFLVS